MAFNAADAATTLPAKLNAVDWLDAKRGKPRGFFEAKSCAEYLDGEADKLISIAQSYGGTGDSVEDDAVKLKRIVSIGGSRVATFKADHGATISWLNTRLTDTFEAVDSLDKSSERSKLTRQLLAIETKINALQSWARHKQPPVPPDASPNRVFEALPDNNGWRGKTSGSWVLGGEQESQEFLSGDDSAAIHGYPSQGTSPPDPRVNLERAKIDAIEQRALSYQDLRRQIESDIRNCVESGFKPRGYILVKESLASLKTVLNNMYDVQIELDDTKITVSALRKKKHAILHNIEEDINEAKEFERYLSQLPRLFQFLRL